MLTKPMHPGTSSERKDVIPDGPAIIAEQVAVDVPVTPLPPITPPGWTRVYAIGEVAHRCWSDWGPRCAATGPGVTVFAREHAGDFCRLPECFGGVW
jgi:hypothetical protein